MFYSDHTEITFMHRLMDKYLFYINLYTSHGVHFHLPHLTTVPRDVEMFIQDRD